MNRLVLFMITLTLATVANISVSQISHESCSIYIDKPGESTSSCGSSIDSSENGYLFTPKGHLHIPIIIMDYDTLDPYPNVTWPFSLFNGTGSNNQFLFENEGDIGVVAAENLSNWYFDMSTVVGHANPNAFKLTGEIIVVPVPYITYSATGQPNFQEMWKSVFKELDQNPIYSNIDWTDFDSRENFPDFKCDNRGTGADGDIDFVVLIQKQIDGNLNGVTTNSPVYTAKGKNFKERFLLKKIIDSKHHVWEIFQHEFAHASHAAPHTNSANSTSSPYTTADVGWGILGKHRILNTINSFERDWLGYASPIEVTQNDTFHLRDFVKTGDALKIPIPNSPGHFLWIENHQFENRFDKKIFFTDQNTNPNSNLSKGLYAYVSTWGKNKSEINKATYFGTANIFKPLPKSGFRDYVWTGDTLSGPFVRTYVFRDEGPNDISGSSKLSSIRFDHTDWAGNFGPDGGIRIRKPPFDFAGSNAGQNEFQWMYWLVDPSQGSEPEPFQTGYRGSPDLSFNQIGEGIGMNLNIPALNIPRYLFEYDSINQNYKHIGVGEYYLNNLQVLVINTDPVTGKIIVDVKFDHNEITFGNKVWAGKINLVDNPSLLSEELLITNSPQGYLKIRRSRNPLFFKNGGSLDFSYPTELKIHNNSVMTLDEGVVWVEDDSKIEVMTDGDLNLKSKNGILLKDNSQLIIDSAGELSLYDSTSIVLYNNSKIIVRNGGVLTMRSSSKIDLRDNSKIIVENGAKIILKESSKAIFSGYAKLRYQNHFTACGLLFQGGIIDFLDNSRIEIEENSIFIFPTSYTRALNLVDNGTVMSIKGKLEFEAGNAYNNDFGIGDIVFDGINSELQGNGLAIAIDGNIYHDKKIILKNSAKIELDAPSFQISDISILIEDDSSELILNSSSCCSQFSNIQFAGMESTPESPKPSGTFILNCQDNLIFDNIEASNLNGGIIINGNLTKSVSLDDLSIDGCLTNGITLTNWSEISGQNIEIQNTHIGLSISQAEQVTLNEIDIHNNSTGVYFYESEIFLERANFYQNSVGIAGVAQSQPEVENFWLSENSCSWFYDNDTAFRGQNIVPYINNPNSSNHHRFDNNDIVFDLCFSDNLPSTIEAKNNYWGNSGFAGISNYFNIGCPATSSGSVDLLVDPELNCEPTGCGSCYAEGNRIGEIPGILLGVFPNPSDNKISVFYDSSIVSIQIFSSKGQEVFSTGTKLIQGSLSVSTIPGVYTVVFNSKDEKYVRKAIIY